MATSGAYYNENDPKKAAVLRELIEWGLIAPGEVDERSIEDVRPDELAGFTQCHFFAGAGIWSYALRLAGWPDYRPVWTGSCPCPSFSAAGKGEGFEDARHLWPAWYRLISERGPATIFGEQVEAAIGFGWVDLVQTDLEAKAYSFGKIVLGACGVGAPHIRLRVYFVADSQHPRLNSTRRITTVEDCNQPGERLPLGNSPTSISGGPTGRGRASRGAGKALSGKESRCETERPSNAFVCTDTGRASRCPEYEHESREELGWGPSSADGARVGARREPRVSADPNGGNACTEGLQRGGQYGLRAEDGCSTRIEGDDERPKADDCGESECEGLEGHFGDVRDWRGPGWLDPIAARSVAEAGATRGFWADCDWWYGRDGKFRPIGAGLFPLAHGAAARVVRLRCYGDGIVPQVAQAFIEAYMSIEPPSRA